MADGIAVPARLDTAVFENAEPPLVSLYLPVRNTGDPKHDRIGFDDAASDAKSLLEKQGARRRHEGVLEPLDSLSERFADATANPATQGIAVLAGNDRAYLYELGYPVEPRVEVSERFFIKPLLKNFAFGAHYLLLGLNADRYSFVRGSFASLDRASLAPNAENEFSQLYSEVYDGHEAALDYRSLENHEPPYHGWKSRNDVKKEDAEKFFRFVNDAVSKQLASETELPLILVALPEHQTTFRKLSTIPTLLDEGIEKNIDGLDSAQLLTSAKAVIERERARRESILVEAYGTAASHGSASSDPAAIGRALVEGKVRALLVEDGRDVSGSFDDRTGDVVLDGQEHGSHGDLEGSDVIDAFAHAALAQGAEIHVLPESAMPARSGVAALFRY